MINTLAERLRGVASLFWREVAKFGAVGGVAFVIDNGLTYYLMHGPMSDSEAKAARLSRYAELRWSPDTSPLSSDMG
jgi:hypothetical protein